MRQGDITREELRVLRDELRVYRNLGATMPWPLYEAQNRKARESYYRQQYMRSEPVDHSLPHVRCNRPRCRRMWPAHIERLLGC